MKRWKLALVLIVLGIIFGLFLSRVLTIRHLRAELARLEAEKAKIQKEIERLSARLAERDNLQLIEYLARKELGMVKPGEELYILIEDGEPER
ncbi:MAG: cell division protein FtsL [Candidatus Bipolaricaulota bacterium]|nr:cell division protein FtsL [Candidatus Bipolaricaulota bacterium]MDW8030743.1 septum formation initiator family protein [Candidatus Bipolaricaulota bacterium]